MRQWRRVSDTVAAEMEQWRARNTCQHINQLQRRRWSSKRHRQMLLMLICDMI